MPIADVGGFSNEPALSLANQTVQELLAQPYDWKFNSVTAALLVTQIFRQDYLFAGASAFTSKGGVGIDLVTNAGVTESVNTVTVKTLQPHNFAVGDTVYMIGNTVAAYNSTFSQTQTSSGWTGGWVITATPTTTSFQFIHATSGLAASGAPGITDCGWLESCTLTDVNSTEPLPKPWEVTCVRKLRPTAIGGRPERIALVTQTDSGILTLRFQNVPGSAFAVTLVYQKKAPLKVDLTQTWAPFPDEYKFVIDQMFLAKCYRFLDHKRADGEFMKAQVAIHLALGKDDTEDSNQHVSPETTLMGDYTYGF
jgi:hypothetical protein